MLPTLFVIVSFLMLYWFPIRRWMNQWVPLHLMSRA